MKPAMKTVSSSKLQTPAESAGLESLWTEIQQALDEAFDAVRNARGQNSELARSLEEKTNLASKLNAECHKLHTRLEETTHEFETTKHELERLQSTTPLEYKEDRISSDSPVSHDMLVLKVRKLEARIGRIADALVQLHGRAKEIRNHYRNVVDVEASMAAEINFARDEALARINEAMKGVHIRRAERRANAEELTDTDAHTTGHEQPR